MHHTQRFLVRCSADISMHFLVFSRVGVRGPVCGDVEEHRGLWWKFGEWMLLCVYNERAKILTTSTASKVCVQLISSTSQNL